MSIILLLAMGGETIQPLLDTDMTIGNDGSNYGYIAGSYGSMDNVDMTNAYTVSAMYWDSVSSIPAEFVLWLQGSSVPNNDDTFLQIELPSVAFVRADAAYDGAAGGGSFSEWRWQSNFNPLGTSGDVNVRILE